MEPKWNPQNKAQYFKNGREENIWSQCPDDDLPELKKKFDKKRFGCRRVEGEQMFKMQTMTEDKKGIS